MLSLELEEFMVELSEGSIQNVGAPNKSATAKLFDVEAAQARAFGDRRVKLAFEDGEGNEIEVALFPEQVRSILDDVEEMDDELVRE